MANLLHDFVPDPLVRLLGTQAGQHFASVAGGLRGSEGRHQAAVVCARRQALDEAPRFVPAPSLTVLSLLIFTFSEGRLLEGRLSGLRVSAALPQAPGPPGRYHQHGRLGRRRTAR
jgi:hypothetical protein